MRGSRIFLSTLFLVLIILAIYFYFIYLSNYLVLGAGLNNNTNWSSELKGVFHSSLVLGDINNDGYLDLVSGGCISGGVDTCATSDRIRVYLNNGTSFTENQTWQQNLTNLSHGSIALGDIDNDADLDLIRGGNINTTTGFVKVYINNGTSFVENTTWEQNLTSITNAFGSSLALGDIDNDGNLDLALIGADSTEENGIYINNGTSFEKNSSWLASLPLAGQGGGNGALALSDIDNDGRLDLVMAGSRYLNWYTAIYLNNGTSLVENSSWEANFNAVFAWPSLILGDYDNNGKIDMAVIGTRGGADKLRIYENNVTSFVLNESEASQGYCCLAGYYDGSLHMGDYDNDGYLDLVAIGRESGRDYIYKNYYTNISQNPYNVTFYGDLNTSKDMRIDNLQQGSLAWSDIDNDTDLDLVINGNKDNTGPIVSAVYLSNRSLTLNNTLPQPPNSSFSASYQNNRLTLSWGDGSDNETPSAGLYYNLRVGTSSGGNQIVSGVYGGSSNPTAGYFGNMMQRRSITISNSRLQANTTYFWSIQTIDTGLAKSAWSAEQNFTLATDINAPSITINELDDNNYTSFSNVTFNVTVSDNVNVLNVSLYGTWGNWHRNQTNSSGINGTDYIFQANLSAYGEGSFTWAIHSCDTTNNCIFSVNRTVIRDLFYPLIYLESPSNASSWTDNNSVTFSFNVTDLGIANCSLIINGYSLKYNFTSVAINTSTFATVSLDNRNYNWSVNCTDMLLRQNSSARRQLTVNYQAPSTPSSGGAGGGSGGGPSYTTYSVGELKEAQEVNKELGKGDKIKFNLTGQEHNLTLKKVTLENAIIEINLSVFNFTLTIGESKKFNLSNAEFYDLLVKLNNIKFFKANLTIMAIHEAIALPKIEKEKPAENIMEIEEEKPVRGEEEKEKPRDYFWLTICIIFLLIIFILILVIKKRKGKWL